MWADIRAVGKCFLDFHAFLTLAPTTVTSFQMFLFPLSVRWPPSLNSLRPRKFRCVSQSGSGTTSPVYGQKASSSWALEDQGLRCRKLSSIKSILMNHGNLFQLEYFWQILVRTCLSITCVTFNTSPFGSDRTRRVILFDELSEMNMLTMILEGYIFSYDLSGSDEISERWVKRILLYLLINISHFSYLCAVLQFLVFMGSSFLCAGWETGGL